MVPINYLAVVLAAVFNMVLGALWYGPVFGKQWMSLMGISQGSMSKNMTKPLAFMAVGSLVMSFVLAHALVFASAYLHVTGISAGLTAGFWNWAGFIAPVTMAPVLWENKSWNLWLLNNGYYLIALLGMGTILTSL